MRETLRTSIRDALVKLPGVGRRIDAYRRNRRVRQAADFIKAGWIYRHEDATGILKDYREVCVDTQLTIAGICNLEWAARYVIERGLQGAFVECGTWRGGAIGFWARSFLRNGGDPSKNPMYGFDSFEGMPRMTRADGEATSRWLYGKEMNRLESAFFSGELTPTGVNVAPENVCRSLVESSGCDRRSIHIVKGWFQSTLPLYLARIGPVAVLRLDGDFYEATRFCMETLYDYVISSGVIIIDDYGSFEGCRKAVDEFLKHRGVDVHLIYVDAGIRYFFKP